MFYRIVEKTVRDGFKSLSNGEYDPIVKKFAAHSTFRFFGEHAMGAHLHEVSAIRQWFERILRLVPDIQCDMKGVKVRGTPLNTLVRTRVKSLGTRADAKAGTNNVC